MNPPVSSMMDLIRQCHRRVRSDEALYRYSDAIQKSANQTDTCPPEPESKGSVNNQLKICDIACHLYPCQ